MACVMIAPSLVVECCDDLTRFHRITVFYQECAEATGRPGGQFGKLLHDLDQANHRVGVDLRAHLDEVRRFGGGFAVEGPGQWGDYSVFGHVCSSWNSCRKAGKNESVCKPWRLCARCFRVASARCAHLDPGAIERMTRGFYQRQRARCVAVQTDRIEFNRQVLTL